MMTLKVTVQRQYSMPGRSAMFAWKPLYTVLLPFPRTDGCYKQNANSKADLKFHVSQHLRSFGYTGKFELIYGQVS